MWPWLPERVVVVHTYTVCTSGSTLQCTSRWRYSTCFRGRQAGDCLICLGPDAPERTKEQRPLIFTQSTILVQLHMGVEHSLPLGSKSI